MMMSRQHGSDADLRRLLVDQERVYCACCGQHRAATRLGLSICLVCAGLLPPPDVDVGLGEDS